MAHAVARMASNAIHLSLDPAAQTRISAEIQMRIAKPGVKASLATAPVATFHRTAHVAVPTGISVLAVHLGSAAPLTRIAAIAKDIAHRAARRRLEYAPAAVTRSQPMEHVEAAKARHAPAVALDFAARALDTVGTRLRIARWDANPVLARVRLLTPRRAACRLMEVAEERSATVSLDS